MSVLSYFDAYTIRARLFPAVIAAAPALALGAASVSWRSLGLPTVFVTLALAVLLFVFADVARRQGKRTERVLLNKLGGWPSIVMLRHSSNDLDEITRERYVKFLGSKLKEDPPSREQEANNPFAADAFYERCGAWLREQTRDTRKFRILFEENVTYGFRRNLLGLKTVALALNVLTVIVCVAVIVINWPISFESRLALRFLPVLVIALFHAAYVILAVNETGVIEAAHQYSKQLILSCETFINSSPAPRTTKPKARKPE